MAEIIQGTTGNDSLSNTKANAIVYAYAGNDTVDIGYDKNNVTVDGGAGNDYVYNIAAITFQ